MMVLRLGGSYLRDPPELVTSASILLSPYLVCQPRSSGEVLGHSGGTGTYVERHQAYTHFVSSALNCVLPCQKFASPSSDVKPNRLLTRSQGSRRIFADRAYRCRKRRDRLAGEYAFPGPQTELGDDCAGSPAVVRGFCAPPLRQLALGYCRGCS